MHELIAKLKNSEGLSHKEIAWIIERLEQTKSLKESLESKNERILNQYKIIKEYEKALKEVANLDTINRQLVDAQYIALTILGEV